MNITSLRASSRFQRLIYTVEERERTIGRHALATAVSSMFYANRPRGHQWVSRSTLGVYNRRLSGRNTTFGVKRSCGNRYARTGHVLDRRKVECRRRQIVNVRRSRSDCYEVNDVRGTKVGTSIDRHHPAVSHGIVDGGSRSETTRNPGHIDGRVQRGDDTKY